MRFLETTTVKVRMKADEMIGSDTSENASKDKDKKKKECKRKGDNTHVRII